MHKCTLKLFGQPFKNSIKKLKRMSIRNHDENTLGSFPTEFVLGTKHKNKEAHYL